MATWLQAGDLVTALFIVAASLYVVIASLYVVVASLFIIASLFVVTMGLFIDTQANKCPCPIIQSLTNLLMSVLVCEWKFNYNFQ